MVSFQDISVKYLPFPHPGISFMAKDLSQIKLYTYFNIGDVETLVRLNEKKVNSPGVVHILIFQQIWGFFCLVCSKFLSSHQLIDWSCYNLIFFIRINQNFEEKSQFLKNGEICRKSQNLSKIWGIKTNFGQNRCPIMWNFHSLKDILISFDIFYISWKHLVWFLSYVILKFIMSEFPLKIVNLPFWIDAMEIFSFPACLLMLISVNFLLLLNHESQSRAEKA